MTLVLRSKQVFCVQALACRSATQLQGGCFAVWCVACVRILPVICGLLPFFEAALGRCASSTSAQLICWSRSVVLLTQHSLPPKWLAACERVSTRAARRCLRGSWLPLEVSRWLGGVGLGVGVGWRTCPLARHWPLTKPWMERMACGWSVCFAGAQVTAEGLCQEWWWWVGGRLLAQACLPLLLLLPTGRIWVLFYVGCLGWCVDGWGWCRSMMQQEGTSAFVTLHASSSIWWLWACLPGMCRQAASSSAAVLAQPVARRIWEGVCARAWALTLGV